MTQPQLEFAEEFTRLTYLPHLTPDYIIPETVQRPDYELDERIQ